MIKTRLSMTILVIALAIARATAQTQPDSIPLPGADSSKMSAFDSLSSSSIDSLPISLADSLLILNHFRKKRSHFETALTYQSDNVYLGRKDSTRYPYFIPAFSYYHKSGAYASVSLNYLKTSKLSRIDVFTIDAGYMFRAHKYDGIFTVSKYFYNSQSTSITSAITSSVAYQNGYDFGIVKPSFTAALNFGNKTDFEGRFELSHAFSIADDKFDLTPTLSAAGSTLNYYDYYRRRKYSIKKKKQPVQTGVADVTGSVLNASTFKILDYELIMPIEYNIGKCTISFTPTYSIPVNPATIDIHTVRDTGTVLDRTKTEMIANSFYFTAGISILF
jgi:hypothetical protein